MIMKFLQWRLLSLFVPSWVLFFSCSLFCSIVYFPPSLLSLSLLPVSFGTGCTSSGGDENILLFLFVLLPFLHPQLHEAGTFIITRMFQLFMLSHLHSR